MRPRRSTGPSTSAQASVSEPTKVAVAAISVNVRNCMAMRAASPTMPRTGRTDRSIRRITSSTISGRAQTRARFTWFSVSPSMYEENPKTQPPMIAARALRVT